MRYELYIDVFFCINFMMDYLLLMLLKKMLARDVSVGRVVLGAASGAALTCAVTVLPVPGAAAKLLLFHLLVNTVMLKAGLRIRWGREFLKAFVFLYIGGMLLGGIMGALQPYLREGSLFFVLALLGYHASLRIWELILSLAGHRRTHCKAVLCRGENRCEARALIDTGNRLRDPVSGKPVSVMGMEKAGELGIRIPDPDGKDVRYIPYRSVGNALGMLPVFVLDKMYIVEDGERKRREISAPVVAVCGGEMDPEEFELILNPDMIFGGNEK